MKRAGLIVATLVVLICASGLYAQGADSEPAQRSLLDLVRAGGPVGYAIILLSLCGLALVVDAFLRLKEQQLIPANLVSQVHEVNRQGSFRRGINHL